MIEERKAGAVTGAGPGEGAGAGANRRDQKKLRTGYTTGANATAAALAATRALLTQTRQDQVTIRLPGGRQATFALHSCEFGPDFARCSCIKDGGDDPDVTHRAEIGATVTWTTTPGIVLAGGPGVGTVTKPGLGLEVGGPAINPVPRRMIVGHVGEAAGEVLAERGDRGLRVEIWVTRGEELARRTLNPRLGIVGGISILGTTGIVVPYSTAAYRATITQGIDVALAQGASQLVFTTGGRSERFAQGILRDLPEVAFIQMGEFLGWSLKEAAGRPGVTKVTVLSMVGKLSKVAQGHFLLHVNNSQVAPAFLARLAGEDCGAAPAVVEEIAQANTARHIQEICLREGLDCLFQRLCQLAAQRMREEVKAPYAIEAILVDFDGRPLGRAEVPAWSAASTVEIVGILDDGPDSLTLKTLRLVEKAEVLVGGRRHLAFFADHRAEKWPIRGDLADLARRLAEETRPTVVLASGDPNFYGIAGYLATALGQERIRIHPNVSAMALAFARVKIPWDGAVLHSVHGRPLDGLADLVRRADKVGLFTDATNSPDAIGRNLLAAEVGGYRAYVCENLGGADEHVVETDLAGLTRQTWAPLNVVILVREREATT